MRRPTYAAEEKKGKLPRVGGEGNLSEETKVFNIVPGVFNTR